MSIIEKQTELGRTLFQINTSTLREYTSMQRDNIGKYVELNKTYGQKLPEVKSISDFVSLQRDYNESIWNGLKESVSEQATLVKGALEETGTALKTAFSKADEAEVEAEAA